MTHSTNPEAQARLEIDRQLTAAGWTMQSRDQMNIFTHRAVAVREFALTTGFADYLLNLNKVFRADFNGLCSAEFIPFRKVSHLESRYLQYFLNSWEFRHSLQIMCLA